MLTTTQSLKIFMQNIVLFSVTSVMPYSIKHNGKLVVGNTVDCVYGENEFVIEGIDFIVNDVKMFDMGSNEIIKHATFENGIWKLKYQYPVFSWLHDILKHGWLIKEDNE